MCKVEAYINMLVNKSVKCFLIAIAVVVLAMQCAYFVSNGIRLVFFIPVVGAVILVIKNAKRWNLKRLVNKKVLYLLVFLGGILRVCFVLNYPMEIVSDPLKCLQAAQDTLRGDFSWCEQPYFQRWGYQIPFVLYESLILLLFNSVNSIYVINAIASILTVLLIYCIIKETTKNETMAFGMSAILAFMPSNIFRLAMLYNQAISGMFVLLAIYLFVISQKRKKIGAELFLSGIALGVAKLLRSDAIIVLIAFGVYFLVCLNKEKNESIIACLMKQYKELILVLLGYIMTIQITDILVMSAGMNDFGIDNRCPYWTIVCGLTPDNYGSYSERFVWLVEELNPIAQKEKFISIMTEISSEMDFLKWIEFFFHKIYNMWAQNDYAVLGDSFAHKVVLNLLMAIDKAMYIALLVMALGLKRVKQGNNVQVFCNMVFVGYFLVYLLIESTVRYRYLPMLVLILVAASNANAYCKTESHAA